MGRNAELTPATPAPSVHERQVTAGGGEITNATGITQQHTPVEHSRRWIRLFTWYRLLLALASLPLLLFFVVPLVALLAQTPLSSLTADLLDSTVVQAVQLSFQTTLIAASITLVLGTPLAYLLARWRFPGRALLDTLIDLPMVMPPAVAGIALLLAFGRFGLLGKALQFANISLVFTPAAVVMAQIFVASPFYIKTAIAAFSHVERDLEQAAALDGASPLAVFRYITLPLSSPALLAGLIMTWARALGEFGATIIFAGNFPGLTQTMPLAIYLGFEQDLHVAVVLSVVLLAVSFIVLLFVRGILRQRIEQAME